MGPEEVVKAPLKNPLLPIGLHGASKAACTTEWDGGKKINSTSLPTAAVMVSGLKTSWLFAPTVTVWILTDGAVVDAGAEVELVDGAAGAPPPYWARARGRESRRTVGERIILDFGVPRVQG